mmetsp:Transcript_66425/g.154367  ORF Transcript_66425/g.154367 Transcript_66425/m.154367 type:complete len:312 (-) Transcript_66425:1127-2062(-)
MLSLRSSTSPCNSSKGNDSQIRTVFKVSSMASRSMSASLGRPWRAYDLSKSSSLMLSKRLYCLTTLLTVWKLPMRTAWKPHSCQTLKRSCCRSLVTINPRLSSSLPSSRKSSVSTFFCAHSCMSSAMGNASQTAMVFSSFASSSLVIRRSSGQPVPLYHSIRSSMLIWSMASYWSTSSIAASYPPSRRTGKPCASSSNSWSRRLRNRWSMALRPSLCTNPRCRQSSWSSSSGRLSHTSMSRSRSTNACASSFRSKVMPILRYSSFRAKGLMDWNRSTLASNSSASTVLPRRPAGMPRASQRLPHMQLRSLS